MNNEPNEAPRKRRHHYFNFITWVGVIVAAAALYVGSSGPTRMLGV